MRIATAENAAATPRTGAEARAPSAARRRVISFFGNFGTRNLGNESTLAAMLESVRKHLPGTAVNCVCPSPGEATARHGVPSVLMSYRCGDEFQRKARRASTGALATFLRRVLIRLPLELVEWVKTWRALEDTRMLVMTGTGMLGDFGIGPFDLHYEILKWSLMARLRGAKLLFVSVGAGPIESALSRWLAKRALALADYRSYRDEFSRSYLASIGFDTRQDGVYPDLAFGMKPEMSGAPAQPGRAPVVGIGLMDYFGKRWSESSERIHATYVRRIAELVGWLLDRGYKVRLLIGDLSYDRRIKGEVIRALQEARPDRQDDGKIIDEPVDSVCALLAQLAATDLVVATRFHGIVLSLLLNKPVIALSYHEKIVSLMDGLGLGSYLQSIDGLELERLVSQFRSLESESPALKARIAAKVEEYRGALDLQSAEIFARLFPER